MTKEEIPINAHKQSLPILEDECKMATRCIFDSKDHGRITLHRSMMKIKGNLQIFGYDESDTFDVIFNKDKFHEAIEKVDIIKITSESGKILWKNEVQPPTQ